MIICRKNLDLFNIFQDDTLRNVFVYLPFRNGLMCKIWRQILNFWGEFFTVGGQEKYFLSASRSQFVVIGPEKYLKIGQRITFFYGQNEF